MVSDDAEEEEDDDDGEDEGDAAAAVVADAGAEAVAAEAEDEDEDEKKDKHGRLHSEIRGAAGQGPEWLDAGFWGAENAVGAERQIRNTGVLPLALHSVQGQGQDDGQI